MKVSPLRRLRPLVLFAAVLAICTVRNVWAAAVVVYINDYDSPAAVVHPDAYDAKSAIEALAKPIADPATGKKLNSGVLPGTKLIDLSLDGDTTIVNFSRQIIGDGLTEARLTAIFKQVSLTLGQFGLDKNVRILAEGRLLSDYLPPTPPVTPRAQAAAPAGSVPGVPLLVSSLSGRSVTLSPGHGYYWTGSGWNTQRPVYCS